MVVYTHVGEITLDGEAVFFHETLAGAFSRAGFVVDSSRRRLLGVIDTIGMFNLISQATRDALARNQTVDVPAALPAQFAARVVISEECDDASGRSTQSCDLGGGQRVNWVSYRAGDGAAVVSSEETQYSLTVAGRRRALERATSGQFPGQSRTTLYNETHALSFQTYNGVNYYCSLRADDSLGAAAQAAAAQRDAGARLDFLGYQEEGGVYCRHFRITRGGGADGAAPQIVHLYEDYVRRQVRGGRRGGPLWVARVLDGHGRSSRAPAGRGTR